MSKFHSLKIKQIRKETPDCVTLIFEIPEDLTSSYRFKAGQYLTLKQVINGEEIRRAYSICTAPKEENIGVSVKKVEGGKMSTYLNEIAEEGEKMEVMVPEGNFILVPKEEEQRHHYFFAAGSGITPVMSMVKTVLEDEPKSTIHLMYGCRNEDHIIFNKELDQLANDYSGQFNITYILSQPKKGKADGVLGILGKKKTLWNGLVGRIDSEKVAKFVQEHIPVASNAHYYICGPGNMIDDVRTTLLGNGIDKENIHKEYFAVAAPKVKDDVSGTDGAVLTAHINGKTLELPVHKNKTILDTLLDAGEDAPYSCTSGACSTCIAKVKKGEAKMDVCFALDKEEVEEGYILTCQAHPVSKEIEVEFID